MNHSGPHLGSDCHEKVRFVASKISWKKVKKNEEEEEESNNGTEC